MQRAETISPLYLSSLLKLCSKSRAPNPAKQIQQQITVHGLHQNSFIITKLIQVSADLNDINTAYKLFAKLPQPNVFAFTSILLYHSRKGNFGSCMNGYREMKFIGVSPDCYVFPKVLKSCALLRCLETGEQVHKDVIMCGAEWNMEVCNSLIDMYSKCGDIGGARRVFDLMEDRALLSWNVMISGYLYNGILDLPVEEILHCMRSEGFEPDIVTWNIIMDAYCRMGKCDDAWDIFRRIEEPNVISWTTMISGYSRTGKHELSLGIFKEMTSKGDGYIDVDCLSSVLASCQQMGALSCGREVHGYGF